MITDNLFNLTEDEIQFSKSVYGKIVKCLIAPYHSYDNLKHINGEIDIFPERNESYDNLRFYIKNKIKDDNDEILIITSNQNIILDMIQTCCRLLTKDGDIVKCPEKTFLANIHTIRHNIIENENVDGMKSFSTDYVNNLISKINNIVDSNITISVDELNDISEKANLIGEELIRKSLNRRINCINVDDNIKFDFDKAKQFLIDAINEEPSKEIADKCTDVYNSIPFDLNKEKSNELKVLYRDFLVKYVEYLK